MQYLKYSVHLKKRSQQKGQHNVFQPRFQGLSLLALGDGERETLGTRLNVFLLLYM